MSGETTSATSPAEEAGGSDNDASAAATAAAAPNSATPPLSPEATAPATAVTVRLTQPSAVITEQQTDDGTENEARTFDPLGQGDGVSFVPTAPPGTQAPSANFVKQLQKSTTQAHNRDARERERERWKERDATEAATIAPKSESTPAAPMEAPSRVNNKSPPTDAADGGMQLSESDSVAEVLDWSSKGLRVVGVDGGWAMYPASVLAHQLAEQRPAALEFELLQLELCVCVLPVSTR